jgi:hypothetical protein
MFKRNVYFSNMSTSLKIALAAEVYLLVAGQSLLEEQRADI